MGTSSGVFVGWGNQPWMSPVINCSLQTAALRKATKGFWRLLAFLEPHLQPEGPWDTNPQTAWKGGRASLLGRRKTKANVPRASAHKAGEEPGWLQAGGYSMEPTPGWFLKNQVPSGTKLLCRFQTPLSETGILEICLSAPWKSAGPMSSPSGCEGYRCRNVPLTPPGEAAALAGAFQSSERREGQQEHGGSILSILLLKMGPHSQC